MGAPKTALALALLGVVLILHGLSRSRRASFEGGSFLLVLIELLAGGGCVVIAAVVAAVAILSL